MVASRIRIVLMVAILASVLSCGEDETPVTPLPANSPPAAVDDLTASVDERTVTLRWSAPADPDASSGSSETGVQRYEVLRSAIALDDRGWVDAARVPQDLVPGLPGSDEQLLIADHDFGDFYYRVRSADADSAWSDLSNQVVLSVVNPDSIPPATVADLSAEIAPHNSVQLRWTAPSDSLGTVAAYQIRSSFDPIGPRLWPDAVERAVPDSVAAAGSEETWIISNLLPLTEYYFAIRSVDDSGNLSQISTLARITTGPDDVPPSAISDLTVTDITENSIEFEWTAPDGGGLSDLAATRYLIGTLPFRFGDEEWHFVELVEDAPTPSEAGTSDRYRLDGLSGSSRGFLAIRSEDETGNLSPLSNVVEFETNVETIRPSRITDLRVTGVTPDAVTLEWTAPGDDGDEGRCKEYELRYGAELDEDTFSAGTRVSTYRPNEAGRHEAIRVETPNWKSVEELEFGILAFDEAGNVSELSNIVSVRVPDDVTPPTPIADLSASVEVQRGVEYFTLTWSAPQDFVSPGGTVRPATSYIGWTSVLPIEEDNVGDSLGPLPSPRNPGDVHSLGFPLDTSFAEFRYFAIQSVDASGNVSDLSNVAVARVATVGTRRVEADGSGDFPTIQDAIDEAAEGEVIELGSGIFRGPGNRDLFLRGKRLTLRHDGPDPEDCRIDCGGGWEGEPRAFIVGGVAPGTRIEGIEVNGGWTNGVGVISLVSTENVEIRNCRFTDQAGTRRGPVVLRLVNSTATLDGCSFSDAHGLSIAVDPESELRVRDSVFATGRGERPGLTVQGVLLGSDLRFVGSGETDNQLHRQVIVVDGGRATLNRATFAEFADPDAGSLFQVLNGDVQLRDCRFVRCRSGAVESERSRVEMIECNFEEPSGRVPYAGAAYESDLRVVRCRFGRNAEPLEGGTYDGIAFETFESSVEFLECIFDRVGPVPGGARAVLSLAGRPPTGGPFLLRRCTFAGFDDCDDCDGSRSGSSALVYGTGLQVENSIFTGNEKGAAIVSGDARCSVFWNNRYGDDFETLEGANIEADPLFCAPEEGNYSIRSDSPCAPLSGPNGGCGLIGALPVACDP